GLLARRLLRGGLLGRGLLRGRLLGGRLLRRGLLGRGLGGRLLRGGLLRRGLLGGRLLRGGLLGRRLLRRLCAALCRGVLSGSASFGGYHVRPFVTMSRGGTPESPAPASKEMCGKIPIVFHCNDSARTGPPGRGPSGA